MSDTQPEVVRLLADLVSIESINPFHDAAGAGEKNMARYIIDWSRRIGVEPVIQPVLPQRDNVLVTVDSGKPGRHLVFEAHMDTVTVTGMTIPPFQPDIRDGLMFGRGSCDTKGGMSAMMTAVKAAAGRRDWAGKVTFAATVDEEYSFKGALKLGDTVKADGAVVAEPTDLKVVTAHRGCVRWKIIAHGRAAHSSKPQLGRNAIVAMSRVILHLEDAFKKELANKVHRLTGPSTAVISMISGGVQVNWVPPEASIQCEVRLIPGQTAAEVMKFVRGAVAAVPGLEADIRIECCDPYLESHSQDVAASEPIAVAALAAANQAEPLGAPYGTDAGKLTAAGMPSVVLGPGSIDQAHGAVEWVELDQVVRCAELYGRIIDRFCTPR